MRGIRHYTPLGPILLAGLATGCGPNEQPVTPANQAAPVSTPAAPAMSEDGIRRRGDQHIAAERGFAGGELLFGGSGQASASPWRGSLGPFRLGMTVDEVRSVARRAGVGRNGSFAIPQHDTAWCAPPATPRGPGLILVPQELNFVSCQMPSGACANYRVKFVPVGENLRASWILGTMTGKRSREVGRYELTPPGNAPRFSSCDLTDAELTRAIRWDNIEDLTLRDTLGIPDYDRGRLPPAVRAALDQWQRSVTVEPDGGCCDVFSLLPGFNAYWTSGENFVVAYEIGVGGDGPYSFPYVVVASPDGRIAWTGSAVEFAMRGLKGRKKTPQEIEQGK